jgi:isocitrate lyase
MELAKQLIQMDAVAIKLPEYFHQPAPIEQSSGQVLLSVDEALKRLVSAREAACSLGMKLSIFACTEARRAVAIKGGRDPRDRKYLSGLTSFDDFRAYCGGLDAAISRAVIYAPHADVVCFKSAMPDISEANKFAAAIRVLCPEKQLAFGYSPRPDGPRWNETDHAAFESELHRLGFDYYFFTQFASTIFPHFPSLSHLVILDDALRMHPSGRKT